MTGARSRTRSTSPPRPPCWRPPRPRAPRGLRLRRTAGAGRVKLDRRRERRAVRDPCVRCTVSGPALQRSCRAAADELPGRPPLNSAARLRAGSRFSTRWRSLAPPTCCRLTAPWATARWSPKRRLLSSTCGPASWSQAKGRRRRPGWPVAYCRVQDQVPGLAHHHRGELREEHLRRMRRGCASRPFSQVPASVFTLPPCSGRIAGLVMAR